jgi:hypothetical protein
LGAEKWPIGAVWTPLGRLRNPISGHIPIFQTVSEGLFSEAHFHDPA